MEKPRDFDTAKAWGEYEPLAAGGYVCEIAGVEETMSSTGKKMIKIALDIAEGDEKGRFMEAYKSDAREHKKWPGGGVAYQLAEDGEGNTHGRFKQFTDCVAASNKGFEIVWGKGFGGCFKGKLVGVVFGREQYESRENGQLRWATKPQYFKTAEDIRNGNFRIPDDRLLEGRETASPLKSFFPAKEEDIPF